MSRSKVVRLSGAAQDVLTAATSDLPEGTTASQRVMVLAERARRAGTSHDENALPGGSDAPGARDVRASHPEKGQPGGNDAPGAKDVRAGHAAAQHPVPADAPGAVDVRARQAGANEPAGSGAVTEQQLQSALKALRYQLLSDFADAG